MENSKSQQPQDRRCLGKKARKSGKCGENKFTPFGALTVNSPFSGRTATLVAKTKKAIKAYHKSLKSAEWNLISAKIAGPKINSMPRQNKLRAKT
ncbi:MAG: hypothetical protein KGO53_06865 [Alphaproteobacteria bacterium]|nr:hypothetical protein [Alphaproteobacteria bacterium]